LIKAYIFFLTVLVGHKFNANSFIDALISYAFGQMNTMGYAAALAIVLCSHYIIAARLAEKNKY